ncbi:MULTISPECIES: hypothetical protein [Paenibacillus]|nr:hypothetical protein [Paenibacillus caseinilyticus]MCZ8521149.1 hypothetical protein [Paenibacillus caseinilyticus]
MKEPWDLALGIQEMGVRGEEGTARGLGRDGASVEAADWASVDMRKSIGA